MQRAGKQVPRPVTHEVGGIPVGEPVSPHRFVVLPLNAVMAKRKISERLRLPTTASRFELVDPVPAVALFQRQHIG
jgi:hypothetical protein